MSSSWLQRLVFCVLFYHSTIHCRNLSKRELERPETVVGEARCFLGADKDHPYRVDDTLYQVPLRDLRTMDEKPNLETDGFTWVSGRPVEGIEKLAEFSDEHAASLEADSVKLIQDLTGVRRAFAFGSAYRDHATEEMRNSVRIIHSDISPEGATWMKRVARDLLYLSKDLKKIDFASHIWQGKDVVIYNVWRPLETVRDNHLGICKWDSLLKEDALKSHPNPTRARDALQPWRYREGQKWFYTSHMEPHEAYVFKQLDERAPDKHGVNVPHASFNLQGYQEPPTRKSFEVKIFAIFDPPSVDPSAIDRSRFLVKEQIKTLVTQIQLN